MKRINIIGTSCAGKSTFAKRLAAALNVPYVELDALHWNPGWIETPDEVMRQQVSEAVAADGWVMDGNYKQVRDLMWNRADTIIWLDYPFPLVMWRALRRTVTRLIRREPCCNGNTETLKQTLSRDSILCWVLTTHHRRQREFPPLLSTCEAHGKQVVILRSPRQAETWLSAIEQTPNYNREATSPQPRRGAPAPAPAHGNALGRRAHPGQPHPNTAEP